MVTIFASKGSPPPNQTVVQLMTARQPAVQLTKLLSPCAKMLTEECLDPMTSGSTFGVGGIANFPCDK